MLILYLKIKLKSLHSLNFYKIIRGDTVNFLFNYAIGKQMDNLESLENVFIDILIKKKFFVSVYLKCNLRLKGILIGQNNDVIMLFNNDIHKTNIISKNYIAAIQADQVFKKH
jgi:hypothetical protein